MVGEAEAREIRVDIRHRALTAQLAQRPQQAREVLLAPAARGPAQAPAVEVDQPTRVVAVEQYVVRVEVGVIEPGMVERGEQAPGFRPRRGAARGRLRHHRNGPARP